MDLGEQSRGGRDESLTAISKDRVEQADVGNKHPRDDCEDAESEVGDEVNSGEHACEVPEVGPRR